MTAQPVNVQKPHSKVLKFMTKKYMKRKFAQTMVEYGLLLCVVAALSAIVYVKFAQPQMNMGNKTSTMIDDATDSSIETYCLKAGGTFDKNTQKCNIN